MTESTLLCPLQAQETDNRGRRGMPLRGELKIMHRLQSDEGYSDWVKRRSAEDLRNAEIADQEQAERWYEFRRDDKEENENQSARELRT